MFDKYLQEIRNSSADIKDHLWAPKSHLLWNYKSFQDFVVPNPRQQTSTSLWPVKNGATQQDVSGRWVNKASFVFTVSL